MLCGEWSERREWERYVCVYLSVCLSCRDVCMRLSDSACPCVFTHVLASADLAGSYYELSFFPSQSLTSVSTMSR